MAKVQKWWKIYKIWSTPGSKDDVANKNSPKHDYELWSHGHGSWQTLSSFPQRLINDHPHPLWLSVALSELIEVYRGVTSSSCISSQLCHHHCQQLHHHHHHHHHRHHHHRLTQQLHWLFGLSTRVGEKPRLSTVELLGERLKISLLATS